MVAVLKIRFKLLYQLTAWYQQTHTACYLPHPTPHKLPTSQQIQPTICQQLDASLCLPLEIYQVFRQTMLGHTWKHIVNWDLECISSWEYTSAKNISVWAEWFGQSGRAPSEPLETPRRRITRRLASRPHVASHITLRSPIHRFFPLCRSPILNNHSGVVANCDHTSE